MLKILLKTQKTFTGIKIQKLYGKLTFKHLEIDHF